MRKYLKVRYKILFVLCLMYFIAYIDRVNISIAAPLLKKEMGLSPTELGLVFSAFAYPYAAMQIIGGWLSDKFGPRKILMILSIIWAISTIFTGLAWGLTSLIVFRLLLGIGEGGAFPSATRAMSYWFPVTERGFAQGITHSFARLGGAVTPPIVLAIVLLYDWRMSFIALGVISLVWTVIWMLYYRDTPMEHKSMSDGELAEIGVSAEKVAKKGNTIITPWKSLISRMWIVTFVDFCYGWSLWVFLTWLPSYLADARGFQLKQMALFAMLPLLAGVIGDTLGGVMSDWMLKKTKNIKLARRLNLVVGLVGSLIFVIPAVYTQSPYEAVYLLSASFFFLELTNAVLWTLPIDIAGKYAGTAGGMMNTGFGVAGMISPVVFGYLIQTTGSYQLPFMLSAALLLVGAIFAMFIDPTKKVQDIDESMPIADPPVPALAE